MSSNRRLKRPRGTDFEKFAGSKRIKLSWPEQLVRSIPKRLEKAIRDQRIARFLRQTVNLLNVGGIDTSWTAHRFLGHGTYGNVALWVQRDDDGDVKDEVAIKEEAYLVGWEGFVPSDPGSRDGYISQEAQIQSTINEASNSQESTCSISPWTTFPPSMC